jgi:signal peptidase I
MTDFSPGDVINFSYYWLPHEAVVTKIQYPETIKCEVVHYNYDGVFGTRTIVEESFKFKLSDQNVFVHDYSEYSVYKQNEVVTRARSRIGEQKFNTFTNRSNHLAKWCKIKQSDQT